MIENIHAEKIDRVIALRDAFCQENSYISHVKQEDFLTAYVQKIADGDVFVQALVENEKDIGYSLLEVDGSVGWIREVFVEVEQREVGSYLALLENAVDQFSLLKLDLVRHICPEKPLECTAAFCDFGFELVREHVQMEMPLQEIFVNAPELRLRPFQDYSDIHWLHKWVGFCSENTSMYSLPEIERLVLKGDDFAFIAYKDDEPVGFMIAEVTEVHNQQESQQVLYIEHMAVAPGYRMRGMATQMLDAVFRKGIDLGLLTAHLHVFHDNAAAYRLYEKLGFVEIKRINHWVLELE